MAARRITTDPELLEPLAVNGKVPRSGILIAAEEIYFHCGKALIRSDLWNPDKHVKRSDSPLSAASSPDQIGGVSVEEIRAVHCGKLSDAPLLRDDTCRFMLGRTRRDYLRRLRYQLGMEILEQPLGLRQASAGGRAGDGRQRDGLMPLDRLFGEESPSDQVLDPLLDREVPEVEGVPHPAVDLVDDERGRTRPDRCRAGSPTTAA